MLDNNFEVILNEVKYEFELVDYIESGISMYHVTFFNAALNKNETFRMKPDENGMFKILAQVLPTYVHELELDFNDAIEDNQL